MTPYSCDCFFKTILPKYGYQLRQPQLALTNKIYQAIDNNKVLIAEAEVGTGKTFAYLFPAIMYHMILNGKILISTKTIDLQEQLIKKDIPRMIEIMRTETGYLSTIQFSLRKGKNNYVCEKKLFDEADSKIQNIDSVLHDYRVNNIVDRRNLSNSLSDKDWEKISAKDCVKSSCKNRECKYRAFKESQTYDILVCNHSYVMSCLKDDNNSLLSDFSTIIFDEAHCLEEVAYDIFGSKINSFEFRSVLKKHELTKVVNCDQALAYVSELFDLLYKHTQFPEIELAEEFQVEISDPEIQDVARKLEAELNTISDSYNIYLEMKNNEDSHKGDHLNRAMDTLINYVKQINMYDDFIWWTCRLGADKVILLNAPKNISDILTQKLFRKQIPIILTSGTMAAHLDKSAEENNFDYFESAIGIADISANRVMNPIQIKSDFDYHNNGLLYIENSVIFVPLKEKEKHERYLKTIAFRIINIIKISHGRSLLLFTSKQEMRFTYNLIKDYIELLGYPCYLQDGNNGTLNPKEKFEKNIPSCLFSASYWEGIDVKGESLSTVIIHKLPFPSPSPSFDYRKSVFDQEDNNNLRDIEMLTKLRQGAGRLIRDKKDRGIVAILDSRASYTNLKDVIVSNLPPFQVTSDLNELEKFFNCENNKAVNT